MFTKKLWLLAVPVAVIAVQGCGGGSLLNPPRGNTTGSTTTGTTTAGTTTAGTTTAGTTTAGTTTAGTTTAGTTTAGTTTAGTTTAGTTTAGTTTAGTTTAGTTTAGTTTTGGTTAGTTAGTTTAGTTAGTTTAGTTTGNTTAGTTTGSTTAGGTTGTTTAGTTAGGTTAGGTTGGNTMGDNIVRYSDVSGSNVDTIQWFAQTRSDGFGNSIELSEVVANANDNQRYIEIVLNTSRTAEPNSGSVGAPFQVGKTYPFIYPRPDLLPATESVTGGLQQRIVGSTQLSRNWAITSGSLIVDRIEGPANNPTKYFFRIVNARLSPNPTTASGATGTFTINYNGDVS